LCAPACNKGVVKGCSSVTQTTSYPTTVDICTQTVRHPTYQSSPMQQHTHHGYSSCSSPPNYFIRPLVKSKSNSDIKFPPGDECGSSLEEAAEGDEVAACGRSAGVRLVLQPQMLMPSHVCSRWTQLGLSNERRVSSTRPSSPVCYYRTTVHA